MSGWDSESTDLDETPRLPATYNSDEPYLDQLDNTLFSIARRAFRGEGIIILSSIEDLDQFLNFDPIGPGYNYIDNIDNIIPLISGERGPATFPSVDDEGEVDNLTNPDEVEASPPLISAEHGSPTLSSIGDDSEEGLIDLDDANVPLPIINGHGIDHDVRQHPAGSQPPADSENGTHVEDWDGLWFWGRGLEEWEARRDEADDREKYIRGVIGGRGTLG
ncbi:hypothetical protein B0J18DRAFT_470095 [Chaetomium sp. MPI-SDFR-AT-0129]|nr:hypothetical protein B0J18DRAFT_470095 [Chaetomium sp. MPI-SDFR-AT-0129]